MENIDIISYTTEQYAVLSETQIAHIREVQQEKDELEFKLKEDKDREKFRLLKNGIYRSSVYQSVCAELDERFNEQVETLRNGLLFYLRYSLKDMEEAESCPYELNYAYSYEERLAVVRTYYETTYSDPKERFAAFCEDKNALNYLGENYESLYEFYFVEASV
ncbi:MAG: hypothetical protein IJV80_00045 [Clostridia bacterium]|nr:hypothetical protein [Clostridia bacterium]